MINSFQPTSNIYISNLLKVKQPYTHAAVCKSFSQYGISWQELAPTKDIWCRDYMPIPTGSGKWVQFKYDPDYLQEYPELRTLADKACHKIRLDAEPSGINMDGGNVVRGYNKAMVTDKIYRENPRLEKTQLNRMLTQLLQVEELIVIPQQKHDLFGHADGMVRWYNEHTVLVNDYSGTQHADYWKKRLGRVLNKHGLNTIPVPYIETEQKNKEEIWSAAGCYINYLQINELIFLPQFGIPEDRQAIEVFNKLKPWTIVPVDCSEIAEAGGVLNCMTWSYNLN